MPHRFRRSNHGVTTPKGFFAAGIHAGIKPPPALDLTLVFSQQPGPVAGVFTKNQLAAASVILNRQKLKNRLGQAIIINSGNANACTGKRGLRDARQVAELVGKNLGIHAGTVFVGSTGRIGYPLPMQHILRAIPNLTKQIRRTGHREAAKGIMTTDTFPKEEARWAMIGGKQISIGGMAKGAGMIHPDMATMLAYITTDAAIEPGTFQKALTRAVEQSFNCISVDGDSSTNDTVLAMANGLAGNSPLTLNKKDFHTFQNLLNDLCLSLALKICQDGEGKTKLVKICVEGAKTLEDAQRVAKTIGTSSLVKTALFGEDPNWGRILAATGRSGASLNPTRIEVKFNQVSVVKNGMGTGPRFEKKAKRIMKQKEFQITINLGKGKNSFNFYTTDLTDEYVKFNASYPS